MNDIFALQRTGSESLLVPGESPRLKRRRLTKR